MVDVVGLDLMAFQPINFYQGADDIFSREFDLDWGAGADRDHDLTQVVGLDPIRFPIGGMVGLVLGHGLDNCLVALEWNLLL
jgi:hypothetical protein